jgi:hypothetical protein
MGVYDGAKSTAAALIKAKGQAVTLTRVSPGAINPATQEHTDTTTSEAFRAVVLSPGPSAQFRIGTLVDRNIRMLYLDGKARTLVPSPGDKITIDGVDWSVIWSDALDPNGGGKIMTTAYVER